MPIVLAAGILAFNHSLFFLGQSAEAWAARNRPDLSYSLTRSLCLGEIGIVLSSLFFLLYFFRAEFFNEVFKKDFPGSVITGVLFSTFFVFVIFVLFSKDEFRYQLMDYYKKELIANAGDTTLGSKIIFGFDIFIASIYEELLFRCLLLKSFANRIGMLPANLSVTALFVLLHFIYHEITLASVAGWTLLSLACGVAKFKTNGWVAPSLVHIIYNSRFFLFAPLFLSR